MSDREGSRREPRGRGRNPHRNGGGGDRRPRGPELPDDVVAGDLDKDVRRDLLTLDKANAESVARHLVMVSRLLEEDPTLALAHARAARDRASRVGVVRETVGIAAYNAGEWQEALTELRAARRITGNSALLPLIADAERGMGRPERAIEIARGDDARVLTGDEATEMRIVEAGARIDLGEAGKAVVTLQSEDLRPGQTGTAAARLFYAYASALEADGRRDDALTWFMNAAAADVDDVTDAEYRLNELADGSTDGAETPQASESTSPGEQAGIPAGAEAPAETETGTDTQASAEPEMAIDNDAPADTEAPEPASLGDDRIVDSEAELAVNDGSSAPDSLASRYDALLLDLDGTVFAGHRALPNAVDTLRTLTTARYFVTNNASRRPAEVAAHLTELGFEATPRLVVTSAQSAARLLAEHLEPGSRALVIGTDGLAQEVREVGIGVTRSADDRPAAVIQGHSPETGWAQLSEAALAIRAGALWVATNVDATLPNERGLLVGNGSMVAAVMNATDKEPLVAGKPAAPLMADAITRAGASRPLVVGDRLDTDIEGAHAVGIESALVLTGVSTVTDLLLAPPQQRPTFVIDDLAGLTCDADSTRVGAQPGWRIDATDSLITVHSDAGTMTALVPALAAAAWEALDSATLVADDLAVSTADPQTRERLVALGVTMVD